MLSFLLRILVLIGVIWLVRRFAALFMNDAKKSGLKNNPADSAKHMVKDPICGMYMDSRLAVRMESGKEIVYFCSEECRNKYLGKSEGDETDSAQTR
jgi:YHS domain-containing protein